MYIFSVLSFGTGLQHLCDSYSNSSFTITKRNVHFQDHSSFNCFNQYILFTAYSLPRLKETVKTYKTSPSTPCSCFPQWQLHKTSQVERLDIKAAFVTHCVLKLFFDDFH